MQPLGMTTRHLYHSPSLFKQTVGLGPEGPGPGLGHLASIRFRLRP
jgi:hypothetical protein